MKGAREVPIEVKEKIANQVRGEKGKRGAIARGVRRLKELGYRVSAPTVQSWTVEKPVLRVKGTVMESDGTPVRILPGDVVRKEKMLDGTPVRVLSRAPTLDDSLGPEAQTEHCKLSYRRDDAQMSRLKGGFVCALSPSIYCCGTSREKRDCPLWSGTAKVF